LLRTKQISLYSNFNKLPLAWIRASFFEIVHRSQFLTKMSSAPLWCCSVTITKKFDGIGQQHCSIRKAIQKTFVARARPALLAQETEGSNLI
jgi:hypothetical protein